MTTQELDLDGVRTPLREAGPADASEAVVFVHGKPRLGRRRAMTRKDPMQRSDSRASARLRRRTASLTAAAALLLPAGAHAAVGDISPLEGLTACNAPTAFAGTTCTPGSPIGRLSADPVGETIGRRVLSSPDGKHVYVISVNDGNTITGRIGVFDRAPAAL